MRLLAITLIAACGGSSAPPPAAVKPSTPAETEEDWRGVLSQWVGTWSSKSADVEQQRKCNWFGAFVACPHADPPMVVLLGYEPLNRRYVRWSVSGGGVIQQAGPAGPSQWSLEGAGYAVVWKRTGATTWSEHTSNDDGAVSDRVWTAAAAPTAPTHESTPPPSNVDWHSELQSLVGSWSFNGTVGGSPLTYTEECSLLPASTYVFCSNSQSGYATLTGWEPQLQRFATYGFAGDQPVHFMPGNVENHNWTFTDGKTTLTMTRKSALEYQLHGTSPDGKTFDGSYSTKPE